MGVNLHCKPGDAVIFFMDGEVIGEAICRNKSPHIEFNFPRMIEILREDILHPDQALKLEIWRRQWAESHQGHRRSKISSNGLMNGT